ncbi:SMP-30/gluconolactonase/LRE family protein [Sphingomonas rhizophila]|uniref:SMP-30/gluconolactonase/LRE family protein n=1 Tax=Sphingomonas rhizophila TaxID=2071607 RepID=UPI0031B6179F
MGGAEGGRVYRSAQTRRFHRRAERWFVRLRPCTRIVRPDRRGGAAPPGNRLNDGCVDPSGRLWFGTMDNGEGSNSGAIYCYDGKLRETGIKGVTITNGPAVSPDGRTLYWVDTLERKISACAIAADGSLGPSRTFVTIDKGYPDGPIVDSQGHVWIGLYAGWVARRYAPDGTLVSEVAFPVGNITKVALGGPDLRTGFATSARQFLKADELARQPRAGALFQFSVDVPGVPCPSVID